MSTGPQVSPPAAFAVATISIAFFSAMDAVMKKLTMAIGVYDTVLWRAVFGVAIASVFFFGGRMRWPPRPVLRLHLIRGAVGSATMILFFWGLARVPLAQGVALSFIAPLIVLYLAAVLLGEKVGKGAVLASLLAFSGVVVILAGQARADLGPKALMGSAAILVAAFLYAYNLILTRQQSLVAKPVEIAFFLNLFSLIIFGAAAPFLGELPPGPQVPQLALAAALAFISLVLLSWAYARAEAHYLVPVEYSALVWAALLGWLIFREKVEPLTIIGAVMIIAGCLLAARRKPEPFAAMEGSA
jgi:S-adenosylmethionine uptake transporter